MKYTKISLTLLIPTIIGGITFAALFAITGHFMALYSHDVYESHRHQALTPLLGSISLFIGFLPALFYVADIIWKPRLIPAEQIEPVMKILTAQIIVGQVFSTAGSNCKLRVKALKNDIFKNADFSKLEYCLNFSF